MAREESQQEVKSITGLIGPNRTAIAIDTVVGSQRRGVTVRGRPSGDSSGEYHRVGIRVVSGCEGRSERVSDRIGRMIRIRKVR